MMVIRSLFAALVFVLLVLALPPQGAPWWLWGAFLLVIWRVLRLIYRQLFPRYEEYL